MTTAEEVLRFWFDEHAGDWFVKNPAFDAAIRARFLPLYEDAAAGRLAHWAESPRGALALIIVLDQFPRNLFRGEARAFATDPMARGIARRVLEHAWDKPMTRSEQLFVYLPFEHSESIEDQDRCVELMKEKDFDERQRWYAERHREIIRRFGRFPHRNAALGRESTPDEIAFLREPGSSF